MFIHYKAKMFRSSTALFSKLKMLQWGGIKRSPIEAFGNIFIFKDLYDRTIPFRLKY